MLTALRGRFRLCVIGMFANIRDNDVFTALDTHHGCITSQA
jgi:hypothetical protein